MDNCDSGTYDNNISKFVALGGLESVKTQQCYLLDGDGCKHTFDLTYNNSTSFSSKVLLVGIWIANVGCFL